MTDSTMTEIPLVERLERPLVIEHAVPTPVHEVLQRAADERGEAAAMLKAAVEALEEARAFVAIQGPAEAFPDVLAKIDNTLASLKQPGGR